VGNLNYPEEARRKQLYGDLTLLVTIRPDGSLKEVKVMRSSGHQVLDDAAMRIVRLAAPYPPFPAEMRKSTDLLEIVRSWQFRRNT
jgi:protein TonB